MDWCTASMASECTDPSRQTAPLRMTWSESSGSDQLFLLARLVLHDVPRDRAGRHGKRRRQIHLSGPAAAGEVSILGADDDLIGPCRNSGSGIDTCSAAGLDDVRSRPLKDLQIPAPEAVLTRLLRAELDVELHRISHALALFQGVG